MDKTELAVVGGGAAGLAAAVMAARAGIRTTVLEKQPRVGKKLLATGNGTCNITNRDAAPGRYHGEQAAFVRPALAGFTPEEVCAFFASLGLPCEGRENGRIYPLCCQAAAVLTCLRLELQARGAVERCGSTVDCIVPEKAGFTLCGGGEELRARFVLLAAGGAAAPALGGGTGSYALAEALGHARTPLFPSIVQLRTDTAFIRAVKGLRVEGEAALLLDGRELLRERGEILFTEYGLSGPAVMQISRPAADWERKKRGRLEVELNLLPGWTEAALRNHLAARRSLPGRTLEEALTGLLQSRLGQTVLRAAGIGPLTRPAASLTDTELDALTAGIRRWRLPVTGTQGFGGAQVTAGGLRTAQFDPITLESRLAPGLYAAGEILDVDGDCGGFNLHWAWASAHAAVEAIIKRRAPL